MCFFSPLLLKKKGNSKFKKKSIKNKRNKMECHWHGFESFVHHWKCAEWEKLTQWVRWVIGWWANAVRLHFFLLQDFIVVKEKMERKVCASLSPLFVHCSLWPQSLNPMYMLARVPPSVYALIPSFLIHFADVCLVGRRISAARTWHVTVPFYHHHHNLMFFIWIVLLFWAVSVRTLQRTFNGKEG